MRLIRYAKDGTTAYGSLTREEEVQPLAGDPFGDLEPAGDPISLSHVLLLAPVVPSKIVAIGLNYRDHAEEQGLKVPEEPILFLKPSTALLDPEGEIVYPEMAARVDYEAELAVVIKRAAKAVPVERAREFILGYTCFNDVTARDLQKKDRQWTRAKSFDTFAPLGPCIVTDLEPGSLEIRCFLNGTLKQRSTTAHLVFPVERLVSFISRVMTLLPGDVIATGTPAGIGPMQRGDHVAVMIEGIGTLKNVVV